MPVSARPSTQALLFVGALALLTGLLTGCGDDNGTVDTAPTAASTTQPDQPAPPPDDPVPPPPDEPPPPGVQVWDFSADPPAINAGDCTMVHWDVETDLPITIDGFDVPPAGAYEMCLTQTTDFYLHAGDQEVGYLTVNVTAPSEPPPPDTPTTTKAAAQATTTTQAQQTTTTQPANCGNRGAEFLTDLAITDIYPGNTPTGQIWVRITNNGPVACTNVDIGDWLVCAAEVRPHHTELDPSKWLHPPAVRPPAVLNIGPGQSQDIPTGFGIDFDKATYHAVCNFDGLNGTPRHFSDPVHDNDAIFEILGEVAG